MSEKITSGDSAFRRNYLRSIIEGVEVDDKVIRIHGSKSALEQAVTNGDSVGKGVRGFIRNWRANLNRYFGACERQFSQSICEYQQLNAPQI
jgi:hypothetical protein